jgi:hypothetical protein
MDAEYALIRNNMEGKFSQRQQLPAGPPRPGPPPFTARPAPGAVQYIVPRGQAPPRGVSWTHDDLAARVAHLDVHYNRELAALQQQAATLNQSSATFSHADVESDGESGYASAGDS